MTLEEFFLENNKVAIGFSGGVDSSYLLYAAKKYGAEIKPYFIKTQFQPDFELLDAYKLAKHLNICIKKIDFDILSDPLVAKNPENRCYHCKLALFGLLKKNALKDGFSVMIDGTNASDDEGDRPGMKAISELSVLSPLKICGITKKEVRRLSKEAGLFIWDKPSYSCLATRIKTNEKITAGTLLKIEKAESLLFSLGFLDFRVRVSENNANLQLKKADFERLINNKNIIYKNLSTDFDNIFLDLKERQE